MRESIEIITCDLCGTQCEDVEVVNYPVVFITEQTECHSCEPYIDNTNIDVCPVCKEKILRVRASGCMGRNNYEVVAR